MQRRTFLLASLSGASLAALTACTSPEPDPTPSSASVTPSATPSPSDSGPAVPDPASFVRSAWTIDPFALGSSSYLAVGATPADRTALSEPVGERVFFAGEATAETGAGTVAGAWSSGLRAAEQVAEVAAVEDRIVVLGAGMAGAAAARQLAAAGFDVVVLEARDRVGGRIDTVTSDDWPFPIERGAFVLYDVVSNPLVAEIVALDITAQLLDTPLEVRDPEGAVLPAPEDVDPVSAALGGAEDTDDEVSLRVALDAVGVGSVGGGADDSAQRELAMFLATRVEPVTGADSDDLSARHGWEGTDGHPERAVVGGFRTVVESALTGVDVRLSSGVSGVIVNDDSIGLRLANGESFAADRVIVTVPLGVLKAESIQFDPPLPDSHRGAIATLGMGTRETVVLRFDEPFWTSDAAEWAVDDDESLVRFWYNLEPLTGEPVLVGVVTAEAAVRFAELSDDEVREAALASLLPFVS